MSIENPQKPHLGKRISRRINQFESKVGETVNNISKRSVLEIMGIGLVGLAIGTVGKQIDSGVIKDIAKDTGLFISCSAEMLLLIKAIRYISRGPFHRDPDERIL